MVMTAQSRARPLAASLLLVLLFVAVCLPTGSIFGLNVKIILFAVLSLTFLFFVATHSSEWLTTAELIFLGLLIGCLCFWGLIAILNGQSETPQLFLQMKDIASTVLIAWLCIYFIRRRLLNPDIVVAAVVYAAITLAVLKLGLVVATLGLHVDPIQLIESVFGEESLVGGSIAFGLVRIDFSSDIVGGLALFALLCPSVSGVRFRRSLVLPVVLILFASALLAYARYIWFFDVVAFISAMIIERRIKVLVTLVLAMIPVIYVSCETLQPLFGARLSSEQTTDSDLLRVEQSRGLTGEIKARPFFGKGLGTHVTGLIRSEQNRYSYEMQWLSWLMQFGIVGVGGILLMISASARDLVASRHPAKLWLLLLFVLWLLGSWTNPYLTSSFAGATFGMFMAMFYKMRNEAPNLQANGALSADAR